jgi:hypothetical protein
MGILPLRPIPPLPLWAPVFIENAGNVEPIGLANPLDAGTATGMPVAPPIGAPVPLIPFSDQCQKLSKSMMDVSPSGSVGSSAVGPGVGSGR